MKRIVLPWLLCGFVASPGCRASTSGGSVPPTETPPPRATPDTEQVDMQERQRQIDEALLAFAADRLDEADAKLTWLATQPPEDPQVLGTLGQLRLRQSRLEEARDLLDKAAALAPQSPQIHRALGQTHEAMETLDEAVSAYEVAYRLEPDDGESGLILGRALLMARRFERAEQVLREVSELDPMARRDGVGVHTLLGDAVREQGRHQQALKIYMKAQSTLASDKMARAGAAWCYDALGDERHAIDEWAAYIRMDCCSEFSKNVAQRYIMEARLEDE